MFQRFEDISISLRITTENPAHQRHGDFKVRKKARPPDGVRRFAEIQDDEPGARFGNAVHFSQTRLPVCQIAQSVTDRDNIE